MTRDELHDRARALGLRHDEWYQGDAKHFAVRIWVYRKTPNPEEGFLAEGNVRELWSTLQHMITTGDNVEGILARVRRSVWQLVETWPPAELEKLNKVT